MTYSWDQSFTNLNFYIVNFIIKNYFLYPTNIDIGK
jgi:hypothetical protein